MDKEYAYKKISSIKIKYENRKCVAFEIDGKDIGHRTTRAEIRFDGTARPTLYIERVLTDCDIEVVADEEPPIWCDTTFLKPPTIDK